MELRRAFARISRILTATAEPRLVRARDPPWIQRMRDQAERPQSCELLTESLSFGNGPNLLHLKFNQFLLCLKFCSVLFACSSLQTLLLLHPTTWYTASHQFGKHLSGAFFLGTGRSILGHRPNNTGSVAFTQSRITRSTYNGARGCESLASARLCCGRMMHRNQTCLCTPATIRVWCLSS